MVFSLADSVSRNKGMYYGLLRLGLKPEKLPAVPQLGFVFTCDIVHFFAKFHLAKVNDAVCTLDNHVYLCPGCSVFPVRATTPGGNGCSHSRYAQRLLDLSMVQHAYKLAGESHTWMDVLDSRWCVHHWSSLERFFSTNLK